VTENVNQKALSSIGIPMQEARDETLKASSYSDADYDTLSMEQLVDELQILKTTSDVSERSC
jgi:hypothetical protein